MFVSKIKSPKPELVINAKIKQALKFNHQGMVFNIYRNMRKVSECALKEKYMFSKTKY